MGYSRRARQSAALRASRRDAARAGRRGAGRGAAEPRDPKQIVKDQPNANVLLRYPKPEARHGVPQGMQTHAQISKHVSTPQVYNDPMKEGYFLVEKIAEECDPKVWKTVSKFEQLSDVEQKRLKSIRDVLDKNVNQMRQVVPDFRPSNIRYRSKQSTQPVLVDFTDEAGLMKQHQAEEFIEELYHRGRQERQAQVLEAARAPRATRLAAICRSGRTALTRLNPILCVAKRGNLSQARAAGSRRENRATPRCAIARRPVSSRVCRSDFVARFDERLNGL